MAYTGRLGGRTSSVDRKACKGSTAASTRREWNAVLTGNRRNSSLRTPSHCSSCSMPSRLPENTSWMGVLRLAATTSKLQARICCSRSMGPFMTAVIAPGLDAEFAINSPRLRATRSRSSEDRLPAAASAVNSPKLWPATATGWMPSCRSKAIWASCTAPIAGCAHRVWVSVCSCFLRTSSLKAGGGKTTSCSARSPSLRSAARSQTARALSKPMARSRPMSTY